MSFDGKMIFFHSQKSDMITWTDALMRLAIDDIAVLAETVGRFASHLEAILGIFLKIVDVCALLVCAERCFIDSVQFHFGKPSYFVRFDWHFAWIVPGQFDFMACDRNDSNVKDHAQNGRFRGKCYFGEFRWRFIDGCAGAGAGVACIHIYIVTLCIADISIDIAIDVRVNWIRNTVQRMNLNGIGGHGLQIVDS